MALTLTTTLATGALATLTTLLTAATAHAQGASGPVVLQASSVALEDNAPLAALIEDIRGSADAFVFLSGGASRMAVDDQRRLLAMFRGLALVGGNGLRIAVGDGGTQAGIMQAAGEARREGRAGFPLIGVAPANEIPPRGATPIDPNHSHIVAVANPAAPATDSWGSETDTMYWLFGKLAAGRPSVTIVANGGGITLSEVAATVRAGRRMIVIRGSGRAADAIVSLLEETTMTGDPDLASLRERVEKEGLTRRRELFQVLPLAAGPEGLRDAIVTALRLPVLVP